MLRYLFNKGSVVKVSNKTKLPVLGCKLKNKIFVTTNNKSSTKNHSCLRLSNSFKLFRWANKTRIINNNMLQIVIPLCPKVNAIKGIRTTLRIPLKVKLLVTLQQINPIRPNTTTNQISKITSPQNVVAKPLQP